MVAEDRDVVQKVASVKVNVAICHTVARRHRQSNENARAVGQAAQNTIILCSVSFKIIFFDSLTSNAEVVRVAYAVSEGR